MKYLLPFITAAVMTSSTSAKESVIGNPMAAPSAVVISVNARFTILSPELIRMEYSPDGSFEDRASFVFINRNIPAPSFKTEQKDGWLYIYTDRLALKFKENSGVFTEDNLSIETAPSTEPVFKWYPGKPNNSNLGGTIRTLDQVSGWTEIGEGLLSKEGWVLIDDSQTLLFDGTELNWPAQRVPGRTDWYFFGYGHDYKKALFDYTQIAGKIPLPPKWVFGSWWSRYWNYTDEEFKEIVKEFDDHDVPLDVLVVDMDWHLDGWTGYTWNPQYFPDPVGFLSWCHEKGLHVPLNLHPHQGVGRHEAAFRDFAKAMGVNPDSTDRIPFNPADPKFMDAYFNILHHPLERQGVDFWWIDWQQGNFTNITGLDPLFWLNHLHWTDMLNNPDRHSRPLFFSRWGGAGGHRYQIGFSGDTHSIWKSLDFQPYFTASAGNVCYPYWSHDIGGHYFGKVEPELYARWIQWGALSPALRTHSTKNPQAERRLWAFPPEIFESARDAFKLRYSLVPYIYTSARECYDTAIPLVRPLYLDYPDYEQSYNHTGEYLFGSQMLCAPVTLPVDYYSKAAVSTVWFPPGKWYHWFTGKEYTGPGEYKIMTPLEQIPIFVKEGGIIPQMFKTVDGKLEDVSRIANDPYDTIVLNIFPGKSGEYILYEDNGDSRGYEKGQFARTKIEMTGKGEYVTVTIDPAEGTFENAPTEINWRIRLQDVWNPEKIWVNGKKINLKKTEGRYGFEYNPSQLYADIIINNKKVDEPVEVKVELEEDYDQIIRDGLKGKNAFLDKIAQAYEKDTGSTRKWDTIIPGNADDKTIYAGINWKEIYGSYIDDKVSDNFKTMLLLRMYGISIGFDMVEQKGDSLTYVCEAVSIEPLPNASVQLNIDAPDDWKRVLDEEKTVPEMGLVKSRKIIYVIPASNQSAVVEAEAVIKVDQAQTKITLINETLPSINSWYIIGPFENPWKNSLETIYPPEKEIDLQKAYTGKFGKKAEWRKVKRDLAQKADLSQEFFINLTAIYGDTLASAYGLTYIDSDSAMQAQLAVGSDDGVIVWLNGKEVHRNDVGRGYAPRQDIVPITLGKGRNTLLIKVVQGWGNWGFSVFLEDKNGEPIPQVRTGVE